MSRLGKLALLWVLGFNGCAHLRPPLARFEYREIHMGVQVRLVVFASDEETARQACHAAYARVGQLDEIMSDWRVDSELMRLCAHAGGAPVRVSDDLFFILERALDCSRRSDGAFDVTVGPLVRLWREARKTKQLPSAEQLTQARALVGWQKVKLDGNARTVQLLVPQMQLDLGGIAKGYAGDCALEVLKQHGISSVLFAAGGDIVLGDPPPDEKGWTIKSLEALKSPSAGKTWILSHCAISTSGDTEQFVEIGDQRYSHIVDPRTGLGLTNGRLVTVLAPDGVTSEGLSKALSILSPERGHALLRTYPHCQSVVREAGQELDLSRP